MTSEQRAKLVAIRRALDGLVGKIAENAAEVNGHMAAIRAWRPGAYSVGDVRMHAGIPYKCVNVHDSTANPSWVPGAVPALWMQYHGTSKETARAWITPTGAHDMYKAGEWMIWTDGRIYRCISDTTYSPGDYSRAWEVNS